MQENCVNLGVSVSNVAPVENYSQDLDLDPETDILLLNALMQILRATVGFFDDFYEKDE